MIRRLRSARSPVFASSTIDSHSCRSWSDMSRLDAAELYPRGLSIGSEPPRQPLGRRARVRPALPPGCRWPPSSYPPGTAVRILRVRNRTTLERPRGPTGCGCASAVQMGFTKRSGTCTGYIRKVRREISREVDNDPVRLMRHYMEAAVQHAAIEADGSEGPSVLARRSCTVLTIFATLTTSDRDAAELGCCS
jgi:hypothetical protein